MRWDGQLGRWDSGLSVTVIEPVSGATVAVPFTVKVDSNVPLGPTESGKHHVHIWFDDNEAAYLVVESNTVQITDAPTGQHTMHVSLRNANHSAAGLEATTPVTIGGGAPGGGGTPAHVLAHRRPVRLLTAMARRTGPPGTVERYSRTTRWFHAITYLIVLVLLGTGWWLIAGREGRPSPAARRPGSPTSPCTGMPAGC